MGVLEAGMEYQLQARLTDVACTAPRWALQPGQTGGPATSQRRSTLLPAQ